MTVPANSLTEDDKLRLGKPWIGTRPAIAVFRGATISVEPLTSVANLIEVMPLLEIRSVGLWSDSSPTLEGTVKGRRF